MRFLLCALALVGGACADDTVSVVDVRGLANNVKFAVNAAAGLINRDGPKAYVVGDGDSSSTNNDLFWLNELVVGSGTPTLNVTADSFLSDAYATYGGILYNSTDVPTLPSVVTLCGVRDAVPMDEAQQTQYPDTTIVEDTIANAWGTQEAAAKDVADRYVSDTTALAIQKPDTVAQGDLVDWIVKEKLFTAYYGKHMCVPTTDDHKLFKSIVEAAPWPKPTPVFGYNFQDFHFGGDMYEAETNCINSLGQVASSASHNFAFHSMFQPMTADEVMPQPTPPEIEYNSSKAYLSLVWGDLDNVDFVQSWARDHMLKRAQRCEDMGGNCFPFSEVLSPRMTDFSPAMMRWYFAQGARSNGQDYFMMPPCGHLYSYPGEMDDDVQANYKDGMDHYAHKMGMKSSNGVNQGSSVHWEWIATWNGAFDDYFPRFVNGTGVDAFFLNNVPWVVPIPQMELKREDYRVIGDANDASSVVAFKPAFNWAPGTTGGFDWTPEVAAGKINDFAKGSVQYIYVLGYTDPDLVFDLVDLLDEDVEVVSHANLAQLARDAEKAKRVA